VARNGAHLRDRRYLPSFQASACASKVSIKVFAAPVTPSFRVRITYCSVGNSGIGLATTPAGMRQPYDGMFDAVPALVERFEGRVWIVSKCGPRIQQRTLQWFDRHRFFERTGIPRNHVRFCLRRPDRREIRACVCRDCRHSLQRSTLMAAGMRPRAVASGAGVQPLTPICETSLNLPRRR
jgi:hypothetical protein